jgi:hypothetical protein
MVIAWVMSHINSKATVQGASFAQSYIIQCGLKKFGQRGADAASKEINQLHQRNCFTSIDVASMTPEERGKSIDALMFLTEKCNKSIKGQMVYNGKPTHEGLLREDSATPTAALESIMLTATVNTKESCDVMTCDILNVFIQTMLPNVERSNKRVIMKILKNRDTHSIPMILASQTRLLTRAGTQCDSISMIWCAATRTQKWTMDSSNGWTKCMRNMAKSPQLVAMSTIILGWHSISPRKGRSRLTWLDYMMAAMVDDFSTVFKPSNTTPSLAAADLFVEGKSKELERNKQKSF